MEANEAKQMEMLLQEGGIADDGTTVDPVSGNEVPPGSMAEEVRDDVPAQLSEGEYVVPADVTRYYGVKFFEDLRTQAKQGMGQMEAEGRIGGEPVSQTMDNQTGGALTPEELAMLQEMGMAVGGMVPPPQAVGNTGEYNKGGQVLYAAPGTDVSAGNASTSNIDPYQAQFTQGMGTAFAPGYLSQQIIDSSQQATQSSVVMLYSPDGIAVSLTLPAEQAKYDQLVAEGYTTEPVATTTETAVSTGNDDPPPPEAAKPVDYTGMSESELQKAYAQNRTAMAMMAGMAAINPIFGAFGAWATNSTKKKIEAEMKKQGYAIPEGGSIFDLTINDIVGKVKDIFGLSEEQTATVAAAAGGEEAFEVPTFEAGYQTEYGQPSGTYSTGEGFSDNNDDDPFADIQTASQAAEVASAAAKAAGRDGEAAAAAAKKAIDIGISASSAAEAAAAGATSIGTGVASTQEDTGNSGGPMYKGGFVSKRSKKNKKKK
jgi:hypothetical protein